MWDVHEGSYDRRLERLRAERSALDPPALTPDRWRILLDALHGEDRAAQRWAEHELALALPDDSRVDEASPEEIWTPEYIAQLEAACA